MTKNTVAATNTRIEGTQNIRDPIAQLPQIITEQVANGAANTTDLLAKKTASYLVAELYRLFQSFWAQTKPVHDAKSNLALLISKYNVKKSHLTQIVEWYNQKAWYEKAGLGISFVAISAVVGAVGNLAALFTLISFSLYCSASYLLINHYDITDERDKQFCNDIVNMEKKLTESIAHLNEVATSVNAILIALNEHELQSAEHLEVFEKKVSTLNDQIARFTETVGTLERSKDALIQDNAKIAHLLEATRTEMDAAKATIIEQSATLTSVNNQFGNTNLDLLARNEELATVRDKFKASLTILTEYEDAFKTQLKCTSNQKTNSENSLSSDITNDSSLGATECLTKNNEPLKQNQVQHEEAAINNQYSEENESLLLERADALIAALGKGAPSFRLMQ